MSRNAALRAAIEIETNDDWGDLNSGFVAVGNRYRVGDFERDDEAWVKRGLL